MKYWMHVMLMAGSLLLSNPAWALDSYRFLHVTIDTPWMIFVFLFFLVFAPMILSALLHWRNAMRRDQEKDNTHE
jgi:hypothetical protein